MEGGGLEVLSSGSDTAIKIMILSSLWLPPWGLYMTGPLFSQIQIGEGLMEAPLLPANYWPDVDSWEGQMLM